jgi:gliding motility-associated-like protein
MRYKLFTSFIFILLFPLISWTQDFSNKGREFWLSYSYHVGMVEGGNPTMTIYLTSEVLTRFTVDVFGGSVIQTGVIQPGAVVSVTIPNLYFINDEGLFSNRAIRVIGDQPLVVYSYITRSAASGATLCLPVNVLGKEYYSVNFTQESNELNSNSYFTIIAVEDNTTVEITPSADTKNGWKANNTYSVNLNKGQIYQVLGYTPDASGVDLTGSRIRSIASGTGGCKRIAVFSGSGKIHIPPTGCAISSSDNLYQQLYPTGTWGKKYLTVPSKNNPYNYYRIIKNDPSASVYVNGILVPSTSFINNTYYQFFNNLPNEIISDKPISVAQYFTTQGCDGNSNTVPNDPDMIILNPVEQNINNVTLVNSNLFAPPTNQYPHQHHIHVIMKNGGSGISTFQLDGAIVSPSLWTVHPSDPTYSYLYLSNVSQGYHRISSDSGFNALAYGYANAESYGYSAGANVKDLYQFVSVRNVYGTVNFPGTCKNSPFYLAMTFPYQPTQIKWVFNGLLPDVTINTPVYDSTWNINGKQLFRYQLPAAFNLPGTGTFPIKVLAQNPTPDGCSGEQDINYDLQVYDRPAASFSFSTNGCLSDSVRFTDLSNGNGRPVVKWLWDFNDGNVSAIHNPAHLYASPGSYNVNYSIITDMGCISDTASNKVILSNPPLAKFGIESPYCIGQTIRFLDSSSTSSSAIVKWYWNFGDGTPEIVASSNAAQLHSFSKGGTYTISLKVEMAGGCQSTVFTRSISVTPSPVAAFDFGNACLPSGTMHFTNNSGIGDGSQAALGYAWNFGDGGNSTQSSPVHSYSTLGPFAVELKVISNAGCKDSITKSVNTIYTQPKAIFSLPAAICLGDSVYPQEASLASGSSVLKWNWDFGDGSVSTQQKPVHVFAVAGTYKVSLVISSAVACTSDTVINSITVNPLPTAAYNITSPVCVGKDVSFADASKANAGNITDWKWDLGDGTILNKNSNETVTHTFSAEKKYQVSLQVKTDKGCTASVFSREITVHPLPLPAFIMPGNCLADPYSQFRNSSSITDGSQSAFSYSWNFGDPNANAANPNTSVLKDPQHKYTRVGSYDVSLTVTSGDGCTADTTQAFFINGSVPRAAITIENGTEACSNKLVTLTNNSGVDVGKIVKLTIQWDQANNPSLTDTITYPQAGAQFTHTYPEFFSPASKTVEIKVVAWSGENCSNVYTQTLQLKATPQLSFDPIPSVCANVKPFTISEASVLNAVQGSGTFSGKGITPAGLFDPSIAGVGEHSIVYTFSAVNGCENHIEQSIKVSPLPIINAGPDRVLLEGGNVILLGTGSGNNISYAWSPVQGLNDPSVAQPTTTTPIDIVYTLVGTSAELCSDSDKVVVTVLKKPSIPNTFSPNGDGIHDRWEIKYLDSYPGATVEIFNRYGQPIFKTIGYNKPWDGTFKGSPLPAGTYYYIIDPKNGRQPMSGFVDIIR